MKRPEFVSRTEGFQTSRLQGWAFVFLLFCGTLLAYQRVWHAGFIWSDDPFLLENPLIKQSRGWLRCWVDSQGMGYFPLTTTALWVEWRLWGTHPLGYHLVNVLVHILNAALVWRVLTRLQIPGAPLAAAIFALHPVNVESVAWVTELKNTLALAFFLGAVLSYLNFEDTGKARWHWLAVGAFAAAVLSKTAAAPLPFVLAGLAWWRRGRLEWVDVRRCLVFFALAAALGLVAVWFQHHQELDIGSARRDSFLSRLAGAGWAICFYLYKALLPVHLDFIYPRWRVDAAQVRSWLPDLALALAFAACWRNRQRWGRPWLLALGYFVVMLLPVLGFVNISFMRYSLVADRWQYFAIIGPMALVAAGMAVSLPKLIMPVFAAILLGALGLSTWRQCAMYSDSETLWRTCLAENPDAYVVSYNLGCVLLQKGSAGQAIDFLQWAADLQPDSAEAAYNLGCAWLLKGQPEKAARCLEMAVELQPRYAKAWCNLANIQSMRGATVQAIASYRKALSIEPDNVQACNNLAWVLATNPDPARRNAAAAVQLARHASELTRGGNPIVLQTLAAAYAEAGKFPEAISAAQKALALSTAQQNNARAEDLRKLIALFQKRLPFHGDARTQH